MKNKIKKQTIFLAAVILFTALPAYCAQTIQQTATKFLFVMCGVAISSLVIYLGLTIYNKFILKHKYNITEKTNDYTEPTNLDESVVLFIKRNQLR